MKKIALLSGIVSCLFLLPSLVAAEDAAASFKKLYLETAHETHELMEMTGEILASADTDLSSVSPTIGMLLKKTEGLEKIASQLKSKEGVNEAGLMKRYMTRLKKAAEFGSNKAEFTANLSNYYLHFNNLLMVTPVVLKDVLNDHLDELSKAISENDSREITHTTEHFLIHADQMYYAAMIFGKRIWQKFSNQIKTDADKLAAAFQSGDTEAMKKLVADLEKPVRMLQKIVKE